ncbi:LysR family transcriptional regulator [Gulosibacter sp. 10]|uniref:LysR family transcriptional regulator n=1 Tax=Gulosibacter sp. 10 TaxID=1255570 RepID=UPI00097ECAD2|nr:LysR family transcriptional regulator [Gulosibacter sp. 10]SJM54691.1 transcriptional regulator, LysR family [Gulosibacter sp. 10]
MNRVTLRQLEYFVAVVDAGSVTLASRQVHVSQATVSMAIAQLERDLDADLLIRHRSKGVAPTRAGRELAARARRLLSMAEELESSALAGDSEMSGPLEIGCVSSLSPHVIPALAAHFDAEHPQVAFDYREGAAGELQEALVEGALDLAIVFSRQCEDAVDSTELAEVVLNVMLPASHPLRDRAEVSFAEIAHEPAILIDLPPSRDRSIEFMRAAGVEPRIRWTSENLATVTALVANGLGYSLSYSLPGAQSPVSSGVVEIPVADPVPGNAISAVLPKGIRPSRRVDEAVRFLRRRLAELETGAAPSPDGDGAEASRLPESNRRPIHYE